MPTPTFTVNPSTDLVQLFVTSPFATGGYQINPWYCASLTATQRFVDYLKEKLNLSVTISFDWPLGAFGAGSPFQQTGMVPYLDFPTAVNPVNGHLNAASVFIEYYQFPNNTADETLAKWLALQ